MVFSFLRPQKWCHAVAAPRLDEFARTVRPYADPEGLSLGSLDSLGGAAGDSHVDLAIIVANAASLIGAPSLKSVHVIPL